MFYTDVRFQAFMAVSHQDCGLLGCDGVILQVDTVLGGHTASISTRSKILNLKLRTALTPPLKSCN
jgi:hypothetical protein